MENTTISSKPTQEELYDLFRVNEGEVTLLSVDHSKDETITIDLTYYEFISATKKGEKLEIKLRKKEDPK